MRDHCSYRSKRRYSSAGASILRLGVRVDGGCHQLTSGGIQVCWTYRGLVGHAIETLVEAESLLQVQTRIRLQVLPSHCCDASEQWAVDVLQALEKVSTQIG